MRDDNYSLTNFQSKLNLTRILTHGTVSPRLREPRKGAGRSIDCCDYELFRTTKIRTVLGDERSVSPRQIIAHYRPRRASQIINAISRQKTRDSREMQAAWKRRAVPFALKRRPAVWRRRHLSRKRAVRRRAKYPKSGRREERNYGVGREWLECFSRWKRSRGLLSPAFNVENRGWSFARGVPWHAKGYHLAVGVITLNNVRPDFVRIELAFRFEYSNIRAAKAYHFRCLVIWNKNVPKPKCPGRDGLLKHNFKIQFCPKYTIVSKSYNSEVSTARQSIEKFYLVLSVYCLVVRLSALYIFRTIACALSTSDTLHWPCDS